jgi:D-arabinose 1-dehydrogenase-like Zn-dependent alcohol dehydrogenase
MENHCPQLVYTFNMIDADGSVTKGGYSTHFVVHERYAILHHLSLGFLKRKIILVFHGTPSAQLINT